MNSRGMDCFKSQKLDAGPRLQHMTKCISWDYCFHFGRKAACAMRTQRWQRRAHLERKEQLQEQKTELLRLGADHSRV